MNLLQFAALCLTSGLVVVFAVVASLFSRRTANVILAGGITVAALPLCTCTCFMFVLRDLHFVSCVPFWLQDLHLPFYWVQYFEKKGGCSMPCFSALDWSCFALTCNKYTFQPHSQSRPAARRAMRTFLVHFIWNSDRLGLQLDSDHVSFPILAIPA